MIRRLYTFLDDLAPVVLPTLARFVFAAVLLRYYLNSAFTKFEGLSISANGYYQILPTAVENAGFDTSQLNILHHLIVYAGSIGEIVLPILVVLGLLTRPAALGMIGFVVVQSVVDVIGHGADATTIGAWFDKGSDALILDQRAFWVVTLAILVFRGAGPLSLDRLIGQRLQSNAA